MRDRPLTECRPERLSAIPVNPGLVTFRAVAAHAAGHQVAGHCGAAVRLWDDVINGWAAAEILTAVGALVVPCQQDLIAS